MIRGVVILTVLVSIIFVPGISISAEHDSLRPCSAARSGTGDEIGIALEGQKSSSSGMASGPLDIIMVSPESFFYATGGLGNAVTTLSETLYTGKNNVSVMTIKYKHDQEGNLIDYSAMRDKEGRKVVITDTGLRYKFRKLRTEHGYTQSYDVEIKIERAQVNGVVYYLLSTDTPESDGLSYSIYDESLGDEPLFNQTMLLTRGVLDAIAIMHENHLIEKPDIIHSHDWQAGLLPAFVKCNPWYRDNPVFQGVILPFSVHNGEYSRFIPNQFFSWLGFEDIYRFGVMEHDYINPLRAGYFHGIPVTVSESYAVGLAEKFHIQVRGIQNGIDNNYWDIGARQKAVYKTELQRILGLNIDLTAPLACLVSRIAEQKGIDLALPAIRYLLKTDSKMQFVFMGESMPGDIPSKELELELKKLETDFPMRVKVIIPTQRKIQGTELPAKGFLDFLLTAADIYGPMPSRFEPSGQMQLRALRYAAVPVVSAADGLADTVKQYSLDDKTGTGFLFERPQSKYDRPYDDEKAKSINTARRKTDIFNIAMAMKKALGVYYRNAADWSMLIGNDLAADFSDVGMGRTYMQFYRSNMQQARARLSSSGNPTVTDSAVVTISGQRAIRLDIDAAA